MLNTSILIILMIREWSNPRTISYLRNVLHLTIALPDVPSGYPYGQISFYPELNILFEFLTENFPMILMEFHIHAYVILVSEFALTLGFVCIICESPSLKIFHFDIRRKNYIPLLWSLFHILSKVSSGCPPLWHLMYLSNIFPRCVFPREYIVTRPLR